MVRVLTVPGPDVYRPRLPDRPAGRPAVGRSGPGTNRISVSRSGAGCLIRCRAAATSWDRLCGGMF
ncbi:hypothetical protein VM98_34310, partial [Streptomyces rubellomurinus subsp. indigoferus]